MGLRINRAKTKLMIIDRNLDLTRSNELQDLECVQEFNYLGSFICNNGSCDKEIIRRIQMSKGAMSKLEKVWRDRSVQRKTKVRLAQSLVFSIFLYGSESWTIKANMLSRIDAFEMWCWRRLLRIPWTLMRTNVSILEELKIHKRLSTTCQQCISSFFGHIARRPDSLEYHIMTGKVEGRRARGRPPAKWSDQVTQITKLRLHQAVHCAEDRAEWRTLCNPPTRT